MPKYAIYPGSFDPITNGHLDVIRRAARMFDRIYVGVACNPDKRPRFSVAERVSMARQALRGVRNIVVEEFDGLTVDFARRKGSVAVVRGLRAISDFEFEVQMALMNRKLDHRVETVFLVPRHEYTFISSRLVKQVAAMGGDVSDLVPPVVEKALARASGARAGG